MRLTAIQTIVALVMRLFESMFSTESAVILTYQIASLIGLLVDEIGCL
jgi:hypothetical protein